MTTRRLALAGLVGPPFFAASVVAVTALEWDFLHDLGWSARPFASPDVPWPSSAALGDSGFLLVLGFALLGIAILALAVALGRLLASRWKVGPALLALVGAGAACAAFRTDYGSAGGGGPETWNGVLHAVGLTIFIPAAIGAMLALAVQLRRDEEWRPLQRRSLAAALIAIAGFAGFVAGAGSLFFYVFLADVLAWAMLVARRVLAAA